MKDGQHVGHPFLQDQRNRGSFEVGDHHRHRTDPQWPDRPLQHQRDASKQCQPLSFFGTLGLIALAGIIINNAIVLIDQIDIERENLPLNDAIVAAARKRFRPILLTSLTTVVGLAPMALAGGALWEPMATLMMGGLGLASILALFWVPALYRMFFGPLGWKMPAQKPNQKPQLLLAGPQQNPAAAR